MQIKIEIDLKPEELRRILGLPDVAGLQDDVVRFLRNKVSQAGENFDPSAVIQGSFDLIKRTPGWRRLRDVLVPKDDDEVLVEVEAAAERAAKAQTASSKRSRNKRGTPAARTAAKKAPRKRAARKARATADETPA
ncbi:MULTISPECIES: hypothetical protein [Hydrocarboniphaga]|jgi:hypothetical protein|uniref:Uncharacterized protein n=1 Tax=Hydrocarboniphaga effusa AP103 TaxID=1172194 RepID=I8I1H4_9GAMM|nr:MULTISPECIES: hypothetical protein [Hydrocarboniphaga]EIT69546.1 hypothetical protein WQQ_31280 [Hydrocarboniphaga effusa AP103]MDZ4080782.1 hypothetical protein [Hydrocarboniphaga sp.]MDZ4080907.1 hypothetical protein [Hydrocarboniphaga sp.]